MTDLLSTMAAGLLRDVGIDRPFRLERLNGGRNNRVYRMSVEGEAEPLLLKSYFTSAADPRDRLAAEWTFANFAWDKGMRRLARPLARAPAGHVALFQFLPGKPVEPGTVGTAEVDQALAFICELNRQRDTAVGLPVASEACFSFNEHVSTIERRLRRLQDLPADDPIISQVRDFVAADVLPTFHRLVSSGNERLRRAGMEPDRTLAAAQCCVSPSDFGFHNALRDEAGVMRFLDFEYAGWDDPAKLIGDFFNQVAVPGPRVYYPGFVERLIKSLELDPAERVRFEVMTRLYAVKWTAIILNEFCRDGQARREFAELPGEHDWRVHQLALARRKLSSLEET